MTNHNILLDDFFTYSYAYYHYGYSLITDHEFDGICIELDNNWDKIKSKDRDLIERDMLRTTSAFNLQKYPRRCVTRARQLCEEQGHDWRQNVTQKPKYALKYCDIHNHSYADFLDECNICVGERSIGENGKLKPERYFGPYLDRNPELLEK